MKINQRIKEIREARKLSQEVIAYELKLSQSQYCRREKGDVKFLADEIVPIAQLLQVSISHLYGETSSSFSIHTQNGGNFGQYITISEKLIEQFEARLREKDELIQLLRQKQ